MHCAIAELQPYTRSNVAVGHAARRVRNGDSSSPGAGSSQKGNHKTPQVRKVSSGEGFVVLAVVPRGGLAVAGARPQAAMQGADEAVAEGPQRLVLEITRGAACAAMSAGRAAMPARPSGTRPVASRSPPAVIRWSSCWVSAQSSPTYRFSGFRLLPVVRLALTVVPATTYWLSAHGHDTPSGLRPYPGRLRTGGWIPASAGMTEPTLPTSAICAWSAPRQPRARMPRAAQRYSRRAHGRRSPAA